MNTKLKALLYLISIIIISSCSNKGNKANIKTEKAIRCYYKIGVPNKDCDTTTTNYNEFGKPTEEISKDIKKIFLYKEDTLVISETQYRLNDSSILYKKNITYNKSRKKESINIYSNIISSITPSLIAGMKIFYDSNNKISERKYFGAINYKEEDIISVISTDPKEDSSSAKYIRNKAGKISQIYFNNDTAKKFVFLYNSKGNIISERDHRNIFPTEAHYYYTNDKLSKFEEISLGKKRIETYNEKGEILEIQNFYSLSDKNDLKIKFTYYDNGNVKEIIKYNYIGEPEYIDKFEYTFY